MNHTGVAQIFFSDTFSTASEQIAQNVPSVLPQDDGCADHVPNAMAAACLVAVLESVCVRAMQRYTDPKAETVIGTWIECRHRAPVMPGALVKVDGWVTRVSDQEATFSIQASDEQEIVCEGQIRLAIVGRSLMERKIQRKCDAIRRRKLFESA